MSDSKNVHPDTVRSFAAEWTRFDQGLEHGDELGSIFEEYFDIFPWDRLAPDARGADIGCGSGRWARYVLPRVAELHCVDASAEALQVARRNLSSFSNAVFHQASIDALPFEAGSLDFAYCLGVLHHVPDTRAALRSCTRLLKPGAPFLLYLYYAFDNRPIWFRALWRLSDGIRRAVARRRPALKDLICDGIAFFVYWPLARLASAAERVGMNVTNLPLSAYRARSLYTMRTDARDRFGTPLEQRFTAADIKAMMTEAGLEMVSFSNAPPYWCAIGFKS